MPRTNIFKMLGLPESVQHVILAVSALAFFSPYLGGMDFGFAKVPDFNRSAIDMNITGPVILFISLFCCLSIWPQRSADSAAASYALGNADPRKLRFGVALGWQLGRFEFIDGSSFPEAIAAKPSVRAEIVDLLAADAFPREVNELSFREMMRLILNFYGTSDVQKHGAILVGVSAMRCSLMGKSSNHGHNYEISELALSALKEIDNSVVDDKVALFQAICEHRPLTVSDVIGIVQLECT